MKNIISFIFTIVLINTLYAQEKYSISFDKDDFTFKESEDGYYILSDDNNFFLLEDTTLPALPYTSINILIPSNSDIDMF